ncbi:MAG: MBL fold metallo-hydrolase, partial [Methanomicrobiales archaeon]|nr:MBL fold metallo-hydrolase [Methanomicrobiales archaeon]
MTHVEMQDRIRYSLIARLPDERGTLQKAAGVIMLHGGNITRIHYDRKIDATTVFFELQATPTDFAGIENELRSRGYLRTALPVPGLLKFTIGLPHRTGALHEFLEFTTAAGANIAYIDFDERGRDARKVTITLTLEKILEVDSLLTVLQARYPLEILTYDTTGDQLDDTVFYLRFAQQLRALTGEENDAFLMQLLGDINHIVQELTFRGKDPVQVFERILRTGRRLRDTRTKGFYADIQRFSPVADSDLLCAQLPCGGNVFRFSSCGESLQIDTGYGIYHSEIAGMLKWCSAGQTWIDRVLITHADADHSGGAGFCTGPVIMSEGTRDVIRTANRAYGSRSAGSILEEVYTHLINLFSGCNPSHDPTLFPRREGALMMGAFPILAHMTVGTVEFIVLESLGGHLFGQVYLVAPGAGLLFTGDSLINFSSISSERMEFNGYADFLMTTVNVDSEQARSERSGLIALARDIDRRLAPEGKRCL